jgi:hypothetical protein
LITKGAGWFEVQRDNWQFKNGGPFRSLPETRAAVFGELTGLPGKHGISGDLV